MKPQTEHVQLILPAFGFINFICFIGFMIFS